MKTCPKCQNKYTDTTLNFCLQDGTELIDENLLSNPNSASSFDETETVISNKNPEQIAFDLNDSNGQTQGASQVTKIAKAEDDSRNSKTLITVLLTALGMLLLFGFAGIGAFFYFNNSKTNIADNRNQSTNINNDDNETTKLETPTPKDNKKPTPKKTKEPKPTPKVDENPEQTKKDVENVIYKWKSLAEARNLNSYMNNYAGRLDYYNKKGASRNFVRKDKQKAFLKYDTIKSTISNMNIKPSADGKTAIAEFDKEWLFTGSEGDTTGKVRSQLKFKKSGSQWLITSERDVKVYYVKK